MSACDDADCVGTGFRRIDFTYDGAGHRTSITETPAAGAAVVTTFRYAGDAIVAEYQDGTLVREYTVDSTGTISKVVIPAGQTGTGTYLVTWNGHGDALALYRIETSGALTLANSYTYSTWGTPTTATHNSIADLGFRFLYVGAWDVQWDGTYGLPLTYMHARTYSPTLGRFLQPDPSRQDAHLFVYGGNGPVSNVDPSGELFFAALGALVLRVVIANAPRILGWIGKAGTLSTAFADRAKALVQHSIQGHAWPAQLPVNASFQRLVNELGNKSRWLPGMTDARARVIINGASNSHLVKLGAKTLQSSRCTGFQLFNGCLGGVWEYKVTTSANLGFRVGWDAVGKTWTNWVTYVWENGAMRFYPGRPASWWSYYGR